PAVGYTFMKVLAYICLIFTAFTYLNDIDCITIILLQWIKYFKSIIDLTHNRSAIVKFHY
ncbi:MAG: hypothetical protein MJA31_18950, partial [Clostridia bacterium]|nr:hypothetical protein [Clostridia bacterium]